MLVALAMLMQAGAAPQPGGAPTSQDRLRAAGMAIVECIEMREAQPTRAAFTAEVRQLGAQMAADPRFKDLTIDDAGGRGCRVSFAGSKDDADRMASLAAKQPPAQISFARTPLATGGELIATTLIDPRP